MQNVKIKLIYSLSVLIGFAQALVIYIASSYLKTLSGREDVSIFYLFSYAIVFVILLNFHKFFRAFGKSKVFFLSLGGEIISILGLLFSHSNWLSICLLILYMIFETLVGVAMDVILESMSKDSAAGRIRGVYLTVFNAGFIAGPLLSTYILANFNFAGIFIIVFILKILILASALTGLHQVEHGQAGEETALKVLKKAWANRDVMRIYYISFALEFFYALMIIYSPIYLRELGLSWQDIGFIFAFMLIPFLVLEYPLGWLADKKWGEKEMIIFFLLLMAVSTGLVYWLESVDVWLWAIVLLLTRIGAASIAILRDSYFYKKIGSKDVDLIDFFRTAMPLAYIIGAIFSVTLLRFADIREIFLLIILVISSSLISALKLKDNASEADLDRIRTEKLTPVSAKN